ncbi:hypothetical protein ACLD43_19235 [Clostridium botulinum]|uniref:hypothetical protein n=1 Tax=Clostridium botulinum TaxID=1491 RepID=UPI003A80DB75
MGDICNHNECNKKIYAKGLCQKHYNHYWQFGNEVGVYKLIIKDKIYIGSAVDQGIKTEINKHKHELINNKKSRYERNQDRKLFKYFNELCDLELGLHSKDIENRKEVYNKFVDYEIIKSAYITEPVEINENGITFTDDIESRRESYILKFSDNEGLKEAYEKTLEFWHNKEKYCIEQYKKLDKKNNTNYCLND